MGHIVLPRLVADGRRFDLALVDGTHRFDGVFLELVYLGRLVRGQWAVLRTPAAPPERRFDHFVDV